MRVQYMFRAIWEFAQSADCIAQTEDPQNACQFADCAILIAQTVEPQVLLQGTYITRTPGPNLSSYY